MVRKTQRSIAVVTALCGLIPGLLAPQALADDAQPAPEKGPVALSPVAPAGAIILYGGKLEDLTTNFYQRYTKNDAAWTVDADGIATPNRHDITSKTEFGDVFIHVEFRCPADENGNPKTSGNSGVCFHGRYEIQILNSYGKALEKHECAALYSEKPPMVNACKKAGEWQTYDITFHAAKFDDNGQVIKQARATVWQNGTLVQDNADFTGPTGIQYGEFKGQVKRGPLILQGDHDPVQFRNVWLVPLD